MIQVWWRQYFQMESTNLTLATFNIPSGPNSWNHIRTSADLEAGEQIIRILGSGTFEMQHIIVEKVNAHTVGGDSITEKVEAESFVQAGQNVIQNGNPITNLGYTIAGTYMDY